MDIAEIRLFAAILAFLSFAAMALVFWQYRTVLFGYTAIAFWNIASASLAGFLVDFVFNVRGMWITAAHYQVFIYTSLGLLAFALGVVIAWRSSAMAGKIGDSLSASSPWLNPRLAKVCFAVGIVAQLVAPVALRVPTVRAAWSAYYAFTALGMLIALLYSKVNRKHAFFLVFFVFFVVLVLIQAVLSGHIGLGGIFTAQLIVVACFWRGFSVRSIAMFGLGTLLIASLMVGWLSSRSIIRSGQLDHLNSVERAVTFVERFEFTSPTTLPAATIQEYVRLRIDMSDILAAQVHRQPEYVSYAYGETIYTNILAAFVPRIIWPNKPVRLGGSEFVSRYSGLRWDDETSVGLPYQFELYANGGAVAVVFGLFFVGWLVAKVERSLYTRRHSLPHFLGLFIVTHGLAGGAQTIVALLMQLAAGYLAAYLLGKFLETWGMRWHDRQASRGSISTRRGTIQRYRTREAI